MYICMYILSEHYILQECEYIQYTKSVSPDMKFIKGNSALWLPLSDRKTVGLGKNTCD